MNRNSEYEAMIQELSQPAPALETTLDRAYKKRRKRTTQMVFRPMTGLAACFLVFVLLVNFSSPVAYACSLVPGLRELAEAVTFSRSLSDAVENEYVQPIALSQTEHGITAEIVHLIVDQKQVNIFYRLNSDQYQQLCAEPDIECEDETIGFCVSNNSFGQENGALLSITVDFTQDDVPDHLNCKLHVYSNADLVSDEPDYLADFDFLLEFDPKFTAAGKVFPVNQTVTLDGQAITVTNIEVYPTHLRVEIAESAENTAWMKNLDFYIETDGGMKFEPVSNGISATGSVDSPSMVSYRADSTYFYDAEHLKLVITGAKWLRKDMNTTYLNLVTGECGALPEGVVFDSATKEDSGWVVTFRAARQEDQPMYQLFENPFYDADGNEYEIHQWSTFGDPDSEGSTTYFYEEFPLPQFTGEEVWLSPYYSHTWVADDLIVITIQ